MTNQIWYVDFISDIYFSIWTVVFEVQAQIFIEFSFLTAIFKKTTNSSIFAQSMSVFLSAKYSI